jgi:hypothetical protein
MAGPEFFAWNKVKVTEGAYVVWLDVMGTTSVMARSIAQASNFVFKMHSHWLQGPVNGVDYYPMNDGAYLTALSREELYGALKPMLVAFAKVFVDEQEPLHRFMVRGGLARGHVVHGRDAHECSTLLGKNPGVTDRILLGPAVCQAYSAEHSAAPFGVFVDQSARTVTDPCPFWRWWLPELEGFTATQRDALLKAIEVHLDWCATHPAQANYDDKRLEHHRVLAREYFEK